MSPATKSILDSLDELRQRWWLFGLFSAIVLILALSIGLLILFISVDALFRLSQPSLFLLFGIWSMFSVGLFITAFRHSLQHQRSLTAAARRVEMAFPELDSHFINLVQLAESSPKLTDPFQLAALEDAASHVARFPIQRTATRHSRWQRWRLGIQTARDLLESTTILVTVLMLAWALHAAVPTWSSSLERLFAPWQPPPQVGSTKIVNVQPGNTTVLLGSRLEIHAEVDAPETATLTGWLEFWQEDQRLTQAMEANSTHDRFSATIASVTAPFRYRLQIGDSETDMFQVDVQQKPVVTNVEIHYTYPAYLDLPPRTVAQENGDLEAPQFTVARLKISSDSPLLKGHLRVGERQISGRVDTASQVLNVQLPLTKNTAYTIHLFNQHGHTDPDPRLNRIRVQEDSPPDIQLVQPSQNTSLIPNAALPVAIRARDDYGLGDIWLEWKSVDHDEATVEEHRWNQFSGHVAATVQHSLSAPFAEPVDYTAILIRAVAEDLRQVRSGSDLLAPQRSFTDWRRITLIDAESNLSDQLAQLNEIQSQLWAILRMQLAARVETAQLSEQTEFTTAQEMTQRIVEAQTRIERQTSELCEELPDNPSVDSFSDFRRAMVNLARAKMPEAVVQAEAIRRAPHLPHLQEASPELQSTQDQIIETLRKLLQFTRRATAVALDQMQKRPGGDLPADVQQSLRELRDHLRDFTKAQKRVIEATKNLAKRPVDDFSEEEDQLFQELAAAEEKWARFMEELRSDFSRLPEQDFANASLLEELVEIQTELKMAQDALTKKTADIAVPLEQLGAEMAEQMTTNLEKWLPDTPDRERWSQEEPLTDQMKEAPMAELPGELEDLVGELMEDEEDLMDEMEDASSSWADSLDKGAGWDAADGPISNMSARGVTGNRLPNTSEISGRSGEGRQGKASGEFVGDTAVGKGGRKTPSRLSPDPFVKGQVKDVSKDPVGGATGGGKESGVGGEGLEGPLSQRATRDMQRLAKKQAELRNRAESIDLKFRVLNYHHTDLEKLIESMAAVERDLTAGRYRSALRRRQVLLKGLANIKTYAEGEMAIRRDESSNLPAAAQQEILSSMQEASPAGWEEMNRRYFRRLATGENESQDPPQP